MKALIWFEGDIMGGPDFAISEMIEHWPNEADEFILLVNENHGGAEYFNERLANVCTIILVPKFLFSNYWTTKFLLKNSLPFVFWIKLILFSLLSPAILIFQLGCLIRHSPSTVVVCSGGFPGPPSNLIFMLATFILRIKTRVFDAHSDAISSSLTRLVSRMCLIWSWRVVCVSNAVIKSLPEELVKLGNALVIYPGIDFTRFQSDKTGVDWPDFKFKILQIGHLSERKGHELSIYALEKLKVEYGDRFSMKFVGPDVVEHGESRLSKLKTLASKIGVIENIEFVGFSDQLSGYIKSADISILPTISDESFGRVLVESMYCKTAVIGSKIDGIVEIIEHETNGLLVEEGSVDDLVTQIKKLYLEPDFKLDLEKKGFKKANCFSIMKNVHAYQRLLDKGLSLDKPV